ncbi:hypothetical protein [Aliarcobacter cibarius]|jgi:hypothetical protein|uniref:Tetratricopeptide repeat-like domain-containing protein n=1 Tax=Aliarcobacter cibarius TaxID=255507 RepID=A0A5J6REB0_9BACT|nr:hypothetical protein [Aliarcobacter cibarius]QEZ88380.1 hypothetical protein ACIB15232_0185 [Aliarcobacter cibarius]QKJ26390.1 hypothetical protein ACBT_0426 [Aliarcobacter cibarius]TLT01878.1 hypothetical protein FE247_00480 [Aliarcobacter cibarius]TLT02213.1 hypothetical protein FE245_00480 [Aliarcobacter cibarius]TLT04644.1 hypothetical protein FE248_03175 [Aliarcobacter cibarius]
MSIKENVDYIKSELSSEEKLLEGFVKSERFFKKYKNLLIALVVAIVLGSIFYVVKKSFDESNKYESNLLLNSYLEKGDEKALEDLKNKNKNLYEVALYLKAKKDEKSVEISLPILKELLEFELAKKDSNLEALDKLSMKGDFLLKDYALFNKALILTNEKKYQEAKDTLAKISNDSRTIELVNLLNHYLLTK